MKCLCPDWKENIPKVNAPFALAQARNPGSGRYDGVRFRYCPWCGSELELEADDYKQSNSANELQK